MAVAKSFDKYVTLERECHEFANRANKPKKICEIRPLALFAMRIPGLCNSHDQGGLTHVPNAGFYVKVGEIFIRGECK